MYVALLKYKPYTDWPSLEPHDLRHHKGCLMDFSISNLGVSVRVSVDTIDTIKRTGKVSYETIMTFLFPHCLRFPSPRKRK